MNASLRHIQITTMPAVNRDEWKSLLHETMGEIAGQSLTAVFCSLRLFPAIFAECRGKQSAANFDRPFGLLSW